MLTPHQEGLAVLAGLGHHMTLGRLAGQQPWHRPPGIGPLSWVEKGPDPGYRDRLVTQCHQRAHPSNTPLHTFPLVRGRHSPGCQGLDAAAGTTRAGQAQGLLPGVRGCAMEMTAGSLCAVTGKITFK